MILRRLEREKRQVVISTLEFSVLKIDLVSHKFWCKGEEIYLTPKEYALLCELMNDPEKVKSRDELLDIVWEYDFVGQTNTVVSDFIHYYSLPKLI